MNPAALILFLILFAAAIAALVRCWFKSDDRYVGWLLLAFFSLLGSIVAA